MHRCWPMERTRAMGDMPIRAQSVSDGLRHRRWLPGHGKPSPTPGARIGPAQIHFRAAHPAGPVRRDAGGTCAARSAPFRPAASIHRLLVRPAARDRGPVPDKPEGVGAAGPGVSGEFSVQSSRTRHIMCRMRNALVGILLAAMVALTTLVAQDKKPPSKLVLTAKNGNVTYDHAAHAKRAKNECKTCHPAQWPQDAKAPLNFKTAMHRPAEANKISCGRCHRAGGEAFETKGNCAKCHVKG